MAPKKRGARKRKTEEALEAEDAGKQEAERSQAGVRKQRPNKKYIGAHVSIQGKVRGRLPLADAFISLRFFCRGDLESCGGLHRDRGQLFCPVSGLPAVMEKISSGPGSCSQVSGATVPT